MQEMAGRRHTVYSEGLPTLYTARVYPRCIQVTLARNNHEVFRPHTNNDTQVFCAVYARDIITVRLISVEQ